MTTRLQAINHIGRKVARHCDWAMGRSLDYHSIRDNGYIHEHFA